MDALLLGIGIVVAAVVLYVAFFYKGGLFHKTSAPTGTSSQSSTTSQGTATVGAGAKASATSSKAAPIPKGAPLPLQGVSGVAVPISSQRGGTNPYGSLSALFLGVGAAGAEQPWGAGPGSGPRVSPPTSASRSPTAVNAGTTGNTAGALSPETVPNLLSGPSGIYTSLQRTLGEIPTA